MHSAITHRHLIDCTNEVRIGTHSTIAGWRTQILTHGIDLTLSHQTSRPVVIGSYCFVGTGSILLKGSRLPDRSVLSAGSVLLTQESEECALYSGVPAQKVRDLAPDSAYFTRQEGFVA
jgi:acetyltransferase-like isoleucine patch superfamily enzyme